MMLFCSLANSPEVPNHVWSMVLLVFLAGICQEDMGTMLMTTGGGAAAGPAAAGAAGGVAEEKAEEKKVEESEEESVGGLGGMF